VVDDAPERVELVDALRRAGVERRVLVLRDRVYLAVKLRVELDELLDYIGSSALSSGAEELFVVGSLRQVRMASRRSVPSASTSPVYSDISNETLT
jgi:hypothetical protein